MGSEAERHQFLGINSTRGWKMSVISSGIIGFSSIVMVADILERAMLSLEYE